MSKLSPNQSRVLVFLKSCKTRWWTAADILDDSDILATPSGLGAALKGLFKRGFTSRMGGSLGHPTQYKLTSDGRKFKDG